MEILYRILEYINYFFIGVASIGFIFQVIYILFIWLRPKHFPEAKTLRKFGIVIAAHNEEEVIGHTVRYMLEKLNYPKDRYDLFVVCHNCTDNTAKVAREAGANIVILEDPDPSHAMEAYPVARGVQELIARGGYDIFVRFDADNLPHPDYLRKMNDAFETGVEIARGFEASTNLKQNNWTKVSGTYYIRDSRIACNFRERAHLDSMLTGAGLTCSMKILEEIGGWDAFETSEDVDFTFRRMIEGKRIHYVADAILYEDQPSTLKDNYARLTRMGNGLNKMFWKKGWAFLGHFFTTGRFSFIDLFMQVFFIPVALVCCLWFPAYYIFYCIVNLINAFGPAFMENRHRAMALLQEEASLNEIVQLVGKDALSADDQLTLEVAKMVREDFLQQNAFMDVDSYSSFDRQMRLLALILDYEKLARSAVAKGADLNALLTISTKEEIGRAKFVEAEKYQAEYAAIREKMEQEISAVAQKGGEDA